MNNKYYEAILSGEVKHKSDGEGVPGREKPRRELPGH
jgi:hypothetical protein